MKQIFDWLREQMEEKSVQGFDGNGNPVNVRFVASIMAEDIITEAEAKWEKDCCEYKPRKAYKVGWCYATECGKDRTRTLGYDSKYCEFCGKPIRILEVE